MSTFSTHYSNNGGNNDGYFSNLGRAARAFLGALLASKPYSELAQKEVIASTEDQRYTRPSQRDIALLNSEAMRHEKFMPNLAVELRFMASRG